MKKELRDYMRKLGMKGGKARCKALSAERRIEIARSGGLAKKKRKILLDG